MSGRSRRPSQPKAFVYVRVSAQPAQGSAREQVETVREFARRRGLRVVGVYRDGDAAGSSRGRPVVG